MLYFHALNLKISICACFLEDKVCKIKHVITHLTTLKHPPSVDTKTAKRQKKQPPKTSKTGGSNLRIRGTDALEGSEDAIMSNQLPVLSRSSAYQERL
jgi:hypothetical protein